MSPDRIAGVDKAANRPTIQIVMASAVPEPDASPMDDREEKSLFRIGEVSRLTATKAFVLARVGNRISHAATGEEFSGHRLYRREDIETVFEIKRLLYEEGFGDSRRPQTFRRAWSGDWRRFRRQQRSLRWEWQHQPFRRARSCSRASRREAPTRQQREFLLDLHEELLAVLTLLERE